ALIDYVEATQRTACSHIAGMRSYAIGDTLMLDAATRRHLEIERSNSGYTHGSPVGLIDCCVCALGARGLRRWLAEPLRDFERLRHRHQAVETLANHGPDHLREALRTIADIERIATRIALASARPRDLTGLGATLRQLPAI